MLKINLSVNGKVKAGTFSTMVDGVLRPTKEAIYIITEAFELEALHGTPEKEITAFMSFSDRTRYEINEKYGLTKYLMILSNRDRVPGLKVLGGREIAFENFKMMTIKHTRILSGVL